MNKKPKINNSDIMYNEENKRYINNKTKTLLIFFMVLLLALVVLTVMAMSPLYEIKKVNASGSDKYSEDEIIRASGVNLGENGFRGIGKNIKFMFSFRNGNAEKAILDRLPYIKEAKVKFVIPDKIVIKVTDREPHMMVACLGAFLLLDKENYVLDSFKEPVTNYPVLRGIEFSYYRIGQPLNCNNPDKLGTAVKIVDVIAESDKSEKYRILDLIKGIDIEDVRNIKLFVNDTLVVNLGDIRDIEYKITFLKEAYFTSIKEETGLLDFTLGSRPTLKH